MSADPPLTTAQRQQRGRVAVNNWIIDRHLFEHADMIEEAVGVYVSTAEFVATQAAPWSKSMPWRLRIPYAWRALTGNIRPVSAIDVSNIETHGWVEGRVQIYVGKVEE